MMRHGRLIVCFILWLNGCAHISSAQLVSNSALVEVAKVQDERQRLRFEVEVQNLGQHAKEIAFTHKQEARNGPPRHFAPHVNVSTVEDKSRDLLLSFRAEANQFKIAPGTSRTIWFEVETKVVALDVSVLMVCILRDTNSGHEVLTLKWQGPLKADNGRELGSEYQEKVNGDFEFILRQDSPRPF